MSVSAATKNPEPRPDDASTKTTAGDARPTRSSIDSVGVGPGPDDSATSLAVEGSFAETSTVEDGEAATAIAGTAGELAGARGVTRASGDPPRRCDDVDVGA